MQPDRNTSPSLFVDDRTTQFFQNVATEVIELVTQQKIRYFAIEGDLTEADELYGESTKKVFRQPVELYCLVLYNEPVVTTGSFSTETVYSLKVYLQKSRIEDDLKTRPKMGDFIQFGEKFYEIQITTYPQLIGGLPNYQMGCYVEALSSREEVFAPNKSETFAPDIVSDSNTKI